MDAKVVVAAPAADPFEGFLLKTYSSWSLYLHENQHYLGRMYAWLKRDGKVAFGDLCWTPELWELFGRIVPDVRRALKRAFDFDDSPDGPDLLNIVWLGNDVHHGHHGHTHFIPRFRESRQFTGVLFSDSRFGYNSLSSRECESPVRGVVLAIRDALCKAFTHNDHPIRSF